MKLFLKNTLCLTLIFALALPFPQTGNTEMTETLSLSNLALPQSLGKIKERFTGTSNRWIIQIQDVHGHVPAQENIAAILDHLQAVYGVKTVGVEGSWVSTALPKSWAVPNSREKQMIARGLLDEGYLTGPGYSAIFTPMPMELIGVEESRLYIENREAFLKYLNEQTQIEEAIKAFSNALMDEKNQTLNPDLLSFDRLLSAYRDGAKMESFLMSLITTAQSHQIEFLKLDQVALFGKILELSQMISKDKLEAEAQRLSSKFAAKRLSFEELLRSHQIPQEELEFYPEMQKYVELMKLQDKVNFQAFTEQTETLIAQVKDKLFQNDSEKALDKKSERFFLLKKLAQLKAVPSDIALLKQDREGLAGIAEESGLSNALSVAEKFYDLALQRDEVFFQKLISEPKLNADTAIVTGGFHTDGLSTKLRAAGISYVVITPDLAGEAPDETLYHKLIQMPPSQENQTLSQYLYFMENLDNTFPSVVQSAQTSKQSLNITKSVEAIMGGRLPELPAQTPSRFAPQDQAPVQGMNVEAFLNLSSQQQTQTVAAWLGNIASAKAEKAVLVAAGEDIEKLAAEAPSVWKLIAEDSSVTLVIPTSEGSMLPDVVLGIRAKIYSFPLAGTVHETLMHPQFKNNFRRELAQRTAAINVRTDLLTDKTTALLLPGEPVSLLIFRMVMASPEMRVLVESEHGYAAVRDILLRLENAQAYLKSA